MATTALITGASKGIGLELAKRHAAAGGDLVLVARSADTLEAVASELREKHGVEVRVFPADLTAPGAAQALFEATTQAGVVVDYLINNAGFGGHGNFHERPLEDEEAMIQLNIACLTALTHLYLKGMVARRRGKILQVASTAGFLPGPLQAVYYATKAYVLSFSQAISEELRDTGVTVTALCPGPVKTEFVERANMEGVNAFMRAATPDFVAKVGYDAMLKGTRVVIDDWLLSLQLNWVVPFLPRWLVLKVSRMSMEKGF